MMIECQIMSAIWNSLPNEIWYRVINQSQDLDIIQAITLFKPELFHLKIFKLIDTEVQSSELYFEDLYRYQGLHEVKNLESKVCLFEFLDDMSFRSDTNSQSKLHSPHELSKPLYYVYNLNRGLRYRHWRLRPFKDLWDVKEPTLVKFKGLNDLSIYPFANLRNVDENDELSLQENYKLEDFNPLKFPMLKYYDDYSKPDKDTFLEMKDWYLPLLKELSISGSIITKFQNIILPNLEKIKLIFPRNTATNTMFDLNVFRDEVTKIRDMQNLSIETFSDHNGLDYRTCFLNLKEFSISLPASNSVLWNNMQAATYFLTGSLVIPYKELTSFEFTLTEGDMWQHNFPDGAHGIAYNTVVSLIWSMLERCMKQAEGDNLKRLTIELDSVHSFITRQVINNIQLFPKLESLVLENIYYRSNHLELIKDIELNSQFVFDHLCSLDLTYIDTTTNLINISSKSLKKLYLGFTLGIPTTENDYISYIQGVLDSSPNVKLLHLMMLYDVDLFLPFDDHLVSNPIKKYISQSRIGGPSFCFHSSSLEELYLRLDVIELYQFFENSHNLSFPSLTKATIKLNQPELEYLIDKLETIETLYKDERDPNKLPIIAIDAPKLQELNLQLGIDFLQRLTEFYGNDPAVIRDLRYIIEKLLQPYFRTIKLSYYPELQKLSHPINEDFLVDTLLLDERHNVNHLILSPDWDYETFTIGTLEENQVSKLRFEKYISERSLDQLTARLSSVEL